MSEGHDQEAQVDHGKPVVSYRTMNMVVSVLLMIVSTIVMIASYRLGAGWAKDVGPDSGYFPFYVSLIMFVTSSVTLLQHLLARHREGERVFLHHREMMMVLQVLVPTLIFVVASIYIGIYISMAVFIAFFMMWHGNYPWYKALPAAVAVPVVLFIVFEIWFLVPLPKGPFEAWLGY